MQQTMLLLIDARKVRREIQVSTLYAVSGGFFLASAFFAQQSISPSEQDRNVAMWTTTFANLIAAVITYLTAREIRIHDSEKKILRNEHSVAIIEIEECKNDRAKIHKELEKSKQKIMKLMIKIGIEDDEDSDNPTETEERRGPTNPDYRGPKRRRDDRGSGSHKPHQPPQLPPASEEP